MGVMSYTAKAKDDLPRRREKNDDLPPLIVNRKHNKDVSKNISKTTQKFFKAKNYRKSLDSCINSWSSKLIGNRNRKSYGKTSHKRKSTKKASKSILKPSEEILKEDHSIVNYSTWKLSSVLHSKKPPAGSGALKETFANTSSNLMTFDKVDVVNSIFPCMMELLRMLARNFDGSETQNEFWRELMKIALDVV